MRSVAVQTRQTPLSELSVPEPKIENIRTFEASLRLDSIAGAGFKISRSKMTELVKSGDVRSVSFGRDTIEDSISIWACLAVKYESGNASSYLYSLKIFTTCYGALLWNVC